MMDLEAHAKQPLSQAPLRQPNGDPSTATSYWSDHTLFLSQVAWHYSEHPWVLPTLQPLRGQARELQRREPRLSSPLLPPSSWQKVPFPCLLQA